MERRNFLKTSCALCGVAVVPGLLLNSCSKTSTAAPAANFTVDLTSTANAALKNVGGSIVLNNVIVIRTSASGYTALSDICTHQGCNVNYVASHNELICPCHGGTFDINGIVVSGPPPSALYKYTVTQAGNILTIKT